MITIEKTSSICDRQNCTTRAECASCILNLVRYHQREIDQETATFDEEQLILTRLKYVFDRLGLIIVTSEGQMQFITPRGKELLNEYFPLSTSDSLPEILKHWLKHQISLLTSKSKVSFCDLPLHIEQASKELRLHLIGCFICNQYLVLLEEQRLQPFSIASLELLGLTKREAEVLFWVAKDKSNAGIAKILNCSKGTVRKHLEHIHQKLGVQTRTAAVIVALEKLGFFKGSFVTISS